MDPITFSASPSSEELSSLYASAVHFLSTRHFDCDWKDMEKFIKIIAFVCENTQIDIKSHFLADFKLLHLFIRDVANIPDSIHNAVLADNILHFYNKYLPNDKLNIRSLSEQNISLDKKQRKMHEAVKHLFSVPTSKFESAFEKLVTNIGFDILGHIFCETTTSIYFEKCAILEDMICGMIKDLNTVISPFLNSMFKYVTNSRKGKFLYEMCLKNDEFCLCMKTFFQVFLEDCKKEKMLKYQLTKCQTQEKFYTLFYTISSNNLRECNSFSSDLRDLADYINLIFL